MMLLQTLVQLHILISAAPALAGWAACWHVAPVLPAQTVRVAYYNRTAPTLRVHSVHSRGQAGAYQPALETPQTVQTARTGARLSQSSDAPASPQAAGILPHAPRAP